MRQSVPFSHADTVFVQKKAYVGKESLLEGLIFGVSQRLSTCLSGIKHDITPWCEIYLAERKCKNSKNNSSSEDYKKNAREIHRKMEITQSKPYYWTDIWQELRSARRLHVFITHSQSRRGVLVIGIFKIPLWKFAEGFSVDDGNGSLCLWRHCLLDHIQHSWAAFGSSFCLTCCGKHVPRRGCAFLLPWDDITANQVTISLGSMFFNERSPAVLDSL